MPFCASCGAPVEGKFCGKCGSPVAAGPAAPGPSPAPPPGGYPAPNPVSAPMQDNVAAALCYVLGLITGIVFLVMQPYSKNPAIRFHAFQSIFLNVAIIVIDIVFTIVFPYHWFGFLGVIGGLVWMLFGLACFGAWLFMIISAYQGKTIVLPVIGPIAQQQART